MKSFFHISFTPRFLALDAFPPSQQSASFKARLKLSLLWLSSLQSHPIFLLKKSTRRKGSVWTRPKHQWFETIKKKKKKKIPSIPKEHILTSLGRTLPCSQLAALWHLDICLSPAKFPLIHRDTPGLYLSYSWTAPYDGQNPAAAALQLQYLKHELVLAVFLSFAEMLIFFFLCHLWSPSNGSNL